MATLPLPPLRTPPRNLTCTENTPCNARYTAPAGGRSPYAQLVAARGQSGPGFLNWTTGSVIIGFMLHLGASATEIGLIASVPMLAQLASPFAAYLGGVTGRLKVLTALTALIGRGLWLLAAFLPVLGVPAA